MEIKNGKIIISLSSKVNKYPQGSGRDLPWRRLDQHQAGVWGDKFTGGK